MNGCKSCQEESCCHEADDIIKCLCELDQELECIKNTLGNKHCRRIAKEKVLFCILLRKIYNLDKKLDNILSELNYSWCSDSDSDSYCDCNCDCDRD